MNKKDKIMLKKFKWAIRKIAVDKNTLKGRQRTILASLKAVKAISKVALQLLK